MEVARKRNKTRFEIFLVDEYSADVYQAAAYGSFGAIENDEERVARLHEAIAEKADPLWRSLNLSYLVIVTKDSFSGLTRESKRYTCTLEPDFRISGAI
ncbi:hypothetical protein [Halioglobus sp. Uisw_031]|jgi:hypothetical protein|uniref:hypothetical protein n=1 Tax=Halioglobus sp. Uisw_031 TaxID=3230977 RepID=UPI0039E95CC0